jgi:integrase
VKTKDGKRTLTIPPDLIHALRKEKARQARLRLELGSRYNPEKFVCVRADGQKWHPESFSNQFGREVRRQDAVPHIHFHELRHTHASHMIWAGVPMPVISERLGHASIQITIDLYGHLQEGVQDREALDALAARRERLLHANEERDHLPAGVRAR